MGYRDEPRVKRQVGLGSDKTITAPTDETWDIVAICAKLATSSTVGAREVEIQITDTDGSTVVYRTVAQVTQIEDTTVDYVASPGLEGTANKDRVSVHLTLPDFTLFDGMAVRAFDRHEIDTSNDQLDLRVFVLESTEH